MRLSELFLAEPHLLYCAVAVLEQMAQRADAGKNTDQHDVHALLLFLHYFVDACHQTKEESILFPALRQAHASVESRPAAAPLPEEIDKLLASMLTIVSLSRGVRLSCFRVNLRNLLSMGERLAASCRNTRSTKNNICFLSLKRS